jgi:hypothetical protein
LYSSPLLIDDERRKLYLVGESGPWLTELDLVSNEFLSVYDMGYNYAFGADDDHLYTASKLEQGNWVTTILRVRKDALAAIAASNGTGEL